MEMLSRLQVLCVREVERADLSQLLPLFRQLIDTTNLSEQELVKAWEMQVAQQGNYWFVVERSGQLLGAAQLMVYENLLRFPHKKAVIDSVIVSEEARGLGVGTQLIDHIIRFAQNLDVMKLYLVSSYKRHKAYSFYRNLGFTDCGLGFEFDM